MTFFFSTAPRRALQLFLFLVLLLLLLLNYNNTIEYCHGFIIPAAVTTKHSSSSTTITQSDTIPSTSTAIRKLPLLVPRPSTPQQTSLLVLHMATISETDAKRGIDKVVAALRKDKQANEELGKLTKVNNILGYGSPKAGVIAVRFNASFQKSGRGMSSVPLPFGLGQSNKSEGRGTMVGQVKASLDATNGDLLECSVFRDLGYGRAFNLQCKKK